MNGTWTDQKSCPLGTPGPRGTRIFLSHSRHDMWNHLQISGPKGDGRVFPWKRKRGHGHTRVFTLPIVQGPLCENDEA